MGIQILKVTPEDFPTLAEIHATAFANDRVHRLTLPKGDTPANRQLNIETLERQFQDPTVHLVKAVDTEAGDILGYARWNIYLTGRSEEELNGPLINRPSNSEVVLELRDQILTTIELSRRNTMGQRP